MNTRIENLKKIIRVIALTAVVAAGTSNSLAVPGTVITWGAAQNISGTNDVSTAGLLVNAFALGPNGVPTTTVNGVTFTGWAFPADLTQTTTTSGNYSFSESFGSLTSYNNLNSGSTPYSGLSSAYKTLLGSAGSSSNPNTLTLTISGLTPGLLYQFQWWNNNSSQQPGWNGGTLGTTATALNSVTLDDNVGNVNGGLGQYVIGTFTANSSAANIAFNGAANLNDPTINAFQLRMIPVPEPSTWAVFGMGLLMLLAKFNFSKTAR